MRALVQRVSRASVSVDGRSVGTIEAGLLVLCGVRKGDDAGDADWIAGKIAGLRVFPDEERRMNRSIVEAGGSVLLVSQFTLYGDVRKGRRPSFESSAAPDEAIPLLDELKRKIETAGIRVATGEFGAHMIVDLVNDGPVTLMLDSEIRRGRTGAAGDVLPTGRFRLVGPDSPLRGVPLVLASASPRRRDLLRDLGLTFTVEEPNVDETVDDGAEPDTMVRELAERKARTVASRLTECIVLAADTIVVLDGEIYGKPSDREHATGMLRALSGRTHEVVTGVCAMHGVRGVVQTRVVRTDVRFRRAGDEEIGRYVATGECFGKAGAYAIQGLGGLLVAGIDGDYSNVVGLPLGATLDLLEEVIGKETLAKRQGASS